MWHFEKCYENCIITKCSILFEVFVVDETCVNKMKFSKKFIAFSVSLEEEQHSEQSDKGYSYEWKYLY